MTQTREEAYTLAGWLIIFGCALFRFLYAGPVPLVPDEAYYWQWSRHIALGYHDHPPMIAWSIYAATKLLGHTEIAVRLPAVLSLTIVSIYLFLIAKRWMNFKAAFYTVILTQSILGFNVAGIIATPDSPLLAGWAGAAYHVARAYEKGDWLQWVIGGAWFGFGMLSKYTMILFPLLVFLFGLAYPKPRKRLASVWPYAGVLLGILMFLPVILWNVDNDWNTFRHVAHKGGVDRTAGLHLNYVSDFILSQAGILSPIVFVLLLMVWFFSFRMTKTGDAWILKYLVFTSFPVPALFTLLSFHTHVEGNWAAPGYLTSAVLISGCIAKIKASETDRKLKTAILRTWPWAVGSSCLVTGLIFLHILWPIFPIPVKLDRFAKETSGWHELGRQLHTMQQSMPNPEKTFIFGLKYQTASEIAFYAPGNPQTVSINKWRRPNAYEYWRNDADLMGWDAVGVGGSSIKSMARLQQIFNYVSPPQKLEIFRKGSPFLTGPEAPPVSTFYLYRAKGFKGGLKWVPDDISDVRAEKS
jgi:undecaprenyl-diphosphatase